MKVLIKQATIVDKRHHLNGRVKDILVNYGVIERIADHIDIQADKTITAPGLCASIGWMDLRANFRDPGDEHKEDLDTGLRAAARGGFTAIALSPATQPPIDHKAAVEFILNRSLTGVVEIFPIGTLTKGLKSESLAEMYDMMQAGAVAFGDDKQSIRNAGLLQRALLYCRELGATVLHFPFDKNLAIGGVMNEGVEATQLGMKGIPNIAERTVVQRDLELLAYTQGVLHLGPLSDPDAIVAVSRARQSGLAVSCDTTAAHLAYSDTALRDFDSNYKLMPPLRSETDRMRLVRLLSEGHIQVVCSDHSPEDEEHKKLEFDYAAYGAAGIEVFFPLVYSACGDAMQLDDLVATFSSHPRQVLGIPCPEITEGFPANLTLFTTMEETQVVRPLLQTKGYNVAELNRSLRGRVVAVLNHDHVVEPNP
jgi:dihydroorotase